VVILGRKDVPGKPLVYGTTKEFLEYFGLAKLDDLPPLQEFVEQEEPEEAAGEDDILPLEEEEEAPGNETEGGEE
jgi:segregation and condensation protein B